MPVETAVNKIPSRAEIDPKLTWDLSDIFASDQAWETEYGEIQKLVQTATSYAGKLHESPATLEACLKLQTEIGMRLHSLYQYAYLNKDLDNRVSAYQAMTERAAMLSSQAGAAFSFVDPELLKMDDVRLVAMEKQFATRSVYDFYIQELLRSKAHIRSAEVEELLAMAGLIARGPDSIFSMLDDADITYPSIIDENGNEVKLTKQRFAKYMESSSQRVRQDTNAAFYSSYKSHINTIGASLAASVNKDVFYTRARKYESCLHRSLDNDNIPVSVYHALLDTTEAHLGALHSYTDLRKRILKLDTIYPYDMLCPLFPEADYTVPYEEAVKEVLEAVRPLGDKYQQVLSGAFDSRWVDVFETEGKGSGAYSWGNYQAHPYVLMNYNDTVDNMFTLAHEMGHAMHSYHSNKAQPFAKAQYSIFVAEVASTLNEGLLMHSLLRRVNDTSQKLYLLNRHLDNTFGTFFHQVLYARFELIIHAEVEKGNALSPDYLTQVWGDLTQKYYGPSLTMDEFTPLKWSRIPHFYNMFYVYQYATSYAASQAILTKFVNGEPGIIERYLELLSSGGKDHPIELLKICGVDMSKPDPVMATIDLFRDQVDEINRLTP
ncbi:MAG: oligoendopeptidase F [candidate division Zixibacteria bacterium]|nr:oligoendopeptidase F [candidate division Zixibacteria bacterium]